MTTTPTQPEEAPVVPYTTYLAFNKETQLDEAVTAFIKRYGRPPKNYGYYLNNLYVGPVPISTN